LDLKQTSPVIKKSFNDTKSKKITLLKKLEKSISRKNSNEIPKSLLMKYSSINNEINITKSVEKKKSVSSINKKI